MNRIYRLVWNRALRVLQVASELADARGAGTPPGGARRLPARRLLALCCLAACAALPLQSAMAACSPINPANGATVTCSGAANPLAPSYASAANNLTVNVVAGGSTGVLLGLGGTAMSLTGNGTTLNNAGTIDPSLLGLLSLLSSGTVIGNPNLGTAIPGSTVTVNNQASGVMKGTTGLLGLNLADFTGMALSVRNGSGGTTTINNAGTIGSSALLGVSLLGSDAPVIAAYGGAQVNITNTGTITGRTAMEASATGNTFINAGTISGSVSMGANSTNTFTAVSGSNVNNGGSLGLNLLGVLGVNLNFAPTGQIDGGAGGNNTLVLQNVVAGPGSGTGGTVTNASSATYINFQHLTVNSGTWNLQGALVSTDATLNGGLANFDNGAAFGSNPITANGGAIGASSSGLTLGNAITVNAGGLTASGANNFTLSGLLSGSGALTKNGAGTLTLGAANTYSGGTVIDAGTIALGASGSLASTGMVNLTGPGATLDISGAGANQTIGALAGAAGTTLALGARTLTLGDSVNTTFSGGISGTGGIVKQGSGTLTLGGASTYTGGTTINAGTLALGAGGSLAAGGAVTLNAAGTSFDISAAGGNPTIGALSGVAGSQVALGTRSLIVGNASSTTYAGTIGGTGGLVKQGSGTLTLSGASTYTGGTTINAGALALGSGGSLAANGLVTLAAGGTFDLSAASAQSLGGLAGAGGTVNIGANALTLAPNGVGSSFGGVISGSGGVTINGTATQTFTGANTYTGATSIQAGTLALGAGGSLAASSALTLGNSGILDISAGGNQTIGALAGTGGTVNLGANVLSVSGSGGGSFDGVIQGTGGVTNTASALVLNGVNTYTGLTTVQAGSLTVGDATHAAASIGGNVTVASGAALGGFGTVGGSVSVLNGGHLAPGNPTGTLTVNGDVTLAQGSVLDFSFGAPGPNFSTPGTGHNVAVNGNLTINGATINPIDAGGFGPGLYNLFTYGGALSETNGGIAPPAGFTIQNLTASKQINLINTNSLALNFWNANGLANSTRMGGGSGTWSAAQANWTDATGSVTSTRQPADAFAIFGGDAGTVTVDGNGGAQPVTALGMQFANDGFHLVGDALGLVAPSPGALSEIRVGDGSAASAGWVATVDNTLTGLGFNKTGAGTLILGGANTYTQGTMLSAGTLSVSADTNLGAASAGLDFEGGILQVTGTSFQSTPRAITFGATGGGFDIADAANVFTVSQPLSGTGSLTKLGAGTLVLSGANSYSGGTTISAGTLQGDASSLQGNITDNALLVFNQGTDGSFAGVVSGTGALTKLGAGTLTLSGANSYSGGTTISAGTLQGDASSLQGSIVDNAALVINQGSDATFNGSISGSGTLLKSGAGTLTLDTANPLTGATTVAAGTLIVGDNSHPGATLGGAVTVNGGATLGGIGTIGALDLSGTVVPGNTTGTLTVTGNAVFHNGSSYQVGATPQGQSSRIVVGGTASILGGSVLVLGQPGNYAPRTDYTILTAAQGLSGQFGAVSANLTFLTPVLSYTANAVNLSLQRNDVSFESVANTSNQKNTAGALEHLDPNSPLYDALLTLDPATARHAFDQLSGEMHGSIGTALFDDSHYVRDAINNHLLGASYGGQNAEGATGSGNIVWSSLWGHWGDHDSDGNAHDMNANGSGVLVGADTAIDDLRVGGLVGHGQNSLNVRELGSTAHAKANYAGLYASWNLGNIRLRGGAAYAWQKIDTTRRIAFGTYSGVAQANYDANTAQAYIDGSYVFQLDRATVEPYLNLSQVHVRTDAFTEHGSDAALAVDGSSSNLTVATAGVRGSLQLGPGGLHAYAGVGYQHASGDRVPERRQRFAAGADDFTVYGLPVADNAGVLDLGLRFPVGHAVTIDLGYHGQFASDAHDQSARLTVNVAF
ncbi:autotransporter-associated beta strand repeat-containing protein [Dyella marensis]|uniref:Outer membrane autotransporter barrel domain-containing protein n=1 Tax=Dyella marensis TaxID=500610 RepID=A0A1I2FIQ8_9GAMM|nr:MULTISPECIES: autotransporter-associated beta strand repeat-containing protein [Dyella]SFF05384.1 outer membrane autotransporter barrel domain-containing protein [Dyella marensis]